MPVVRRTFRARAFVNILVFLSFTAVVISGIALYLRPEGSLARWTGWTFLGLDKRHWENVHIAFVSAFIVGGIIHLAYNLKALLSYFRIRAGTAAGPPSRRVPFVPELTAALLLLGAIYLGTRFELPPVSSITGLRSSIKEGRYSVGVPPPILDADRLTVSAACRLLSLAEPEALANARRRGIIIDDPSRSLADIAESSELTPQEVFQALNDY